MLQSLLIFHFLTGKELRLRLEYRLNHEQRHSMNKEPGDPVERMLLHFSCNISTFPTPVRTTLPLDLRIVEITSTKSSPKFEDRLCMASPSIFSEFCSI